MRVSAVVAAAGAGRRIGGAIVKTYLPIAGRPLILRTLDRIFSTPVVNQAVVVAAGEEVERCAALLRADAGLSDRSWLLAIGGATRQHSVRRGLEKVGADTDVVIVHDGARPFVSAALIERCVGAAVEKGAAVAGLPVRDTIKNVSAGGWVQATPDRGSLWEIQTPQAFRRDIIVAAHEKAARDGVEASDDAMLVERMGTPVFVVNGERLNFKITVPEDVWLAELIIRERPAC
jgi:2-C-methyl-D-erythritol 4-phosphate cytidylyltransferase